MTQRLAGEVAVITGGNSGIGFATAQRFVAKGAYVFITGRREAELDVPVKQIGRNATGVQGDVANLADPDRLYATVQLCLGQVAQSPWRPATDTASATIRATGSMTADGGTAL
jgi:NAD(P)-dependent dehydrogenase (short-subunit alcohol dehydrogenase family)